MRPQQREARPTAWAISFNIADVNMYYSGAERLRPQGARKPPGGGRGAEEEKGAEMMLEIIKVLIALPPSMVAAVMLYHLVRPGKGKHREKDRQ